MKLLIILAMHGTSAEVTEDISGKTLTCLYSFNIIFNVLLAIGILIKKLAEKFCKRR